MRGGREGGEIESSIVVFRDATLTVEEPLEVSGKPDLDGVRIVNAE